LDIIKSFSGNSKQGIVTAKTIGQTTVYAITKIEKVGECIVHVVPVEAEAVQISISDVAIMVSQTYQLTAQILPSNVSNTSIHGHLQIKVL
jgi:hypothetical protein